MEKWKIFSPIITCGNNVSHALDRPTIVENDPMLINVFARVTAASSLEPMWPQKNKLMIGKNVWLKLLNIFFVFILSRIFWMICFY